MNIRDLFLRSSFGLSRRESKAAVMQHAKYLCSGISTPLDVYFVQTRLNEGGSTGCVFDDANRLDRCRIRLNNLRIDNSHNRDSLDFAFIHSLVAAGHEARHVIQIESKDPEFALSYLAECGNVANYKTNYKFNRREIDAERSGLMFAQDFLSSQFPNIDGDSFLLLYVNCCAFSDATYWIDAPENGFTSMAEVFQAFDGAYDDAKTHVNKYPAKASPTCEDAITRWTGAGSRKGFNHDWVFVYDALLNAGSQYESNMILASIALHDDPDLIKYAAGAELPDLSIQAVFGRSAPDAPVVESASEFERKPVRSPKMAALMRKAEQAKSRDPGHDREFTD